MSWVHLDVEEIFEETDNAFLLELEDGEEVWMPYSQISDYENYRKGDKNCTISISEWIARQKGL